MEDTNNSPNLVVGYSVHEIEVKCKYKQKIYVVDE